MEATQISITCRFGLFFLLLQVFLVQLDELREHAVQRRAAEADGGEQLAYPQGPMGVHTWMARTDAGGRLVSIDNVMQPRYFARIQAGMSQDEVLRALRTLRIAPLLDGVRGDPPLDVQALAEIAVAVGQVIAGARGTMASVDLNPVMVGAAGEGAVVVDALVECAGLPASGL